MRFFSVLIITALALCSNLAFSRELSGNLDFTLNTDNGEAKLTLINKTPDTPVRISAVAILLKNPSVKELPITVPSGQSIPQSLVVDLGSAAYLAQLIVPTANPSQYQATASDSDRINCVNCTVKVVGFPLQIDVEYEGGVKQRTTTVVFMHYVAR